MSTKDNVRNKKGDKYESQRPVPCVRSAADDHDSHSRVVRGQAQSNARG